MIKKDISVRGAKALLLGFTFKEDCPDIRNTKVVDIYNELQEFGIGVDVFDPWASPDEVYKEYGVRLLNELSSMSYDAIILATAHSEFLNIDISNIKKQNGVVFDAKGILPRAWVDARL